MTSGRWQITAMITVSGLLSVLAIGVARSQGEAEGKTVYQASCVACHAAGVLQAPRPGQREDWLERESQGFETLLEHALDGFRNMPAKGGNPTLSDQQVESAVRYMLVTSGFEKYAVSESPPVTKPELNTEAGETAVDIARLQKPKVNANRFNRLMKPPEEWNLAPPRDGIHDPDNPGTLMLQAPLEAFSSLSPSRTGNRVDWVAALENEEIAPRYDRLSDEARPVVMDLNIVREVKGSMPDVVIPTSSTPSGSTALTATPRSSCRRKAQTRFRWPRSCWDKVAVFVTARSPSRSRNAVGAIRGRKR